MFTTGLPLVYHLFTAGLPLVNLHASYTPVRFHKPHGGFCYIQTHQENCGYDRDWSNEFQQQPNGTSGAEEKVDKPDNDQRPHQLKLMFVRNVFYNHFVLCYEDKT